MNAGARHAPPDRHDEPDAVGDPADGARVRIIGGHPTVEEVAALVVALRQAGKWRPPSSRSMSVLPGCSDSPAWARAARFESLGAAPVAAPGDLQRVE